MQKFGRDGRFMQDALNLFDHQKLQKFFDELGVQTHAPDGFRIFPTSHNSQTIIDAFIKELQKLDVDIKTNTKVDDISLKDNLLYAQTQEKIFYAKHIIVATGGLGYPTLGSNGDGHHIAKKLGHSITPLYPAMMPLKTKEDWVSFCRADTIPKVTIKVNLKKYKKLKATGDLIFTKNGIRGPVVLDFAREITPILDKYDEVPILLNFTKGMNEEEILHHLKQANQKNPTHNIVTLLTTLIPKSLATELCSLAQINTTQTLHQIQGEKKDKLIKLLAWTPLHIIGHDGFKMAMITRGGIHLKEINPKTMQSKHIKNLYFCGEILNIDGPCGGYNLQWAFASGYLAGQLLKSDTI
ncbi:NAD(FAD)-utilizing dehydrogenases [hydrothermal vent metagenome]|uniref:NAD(FAD)-utilizing dehydrogenases n=1 Tax=hydrothermal vent metagenome TaxID=652676 RepID=A0A1W1D445_9ZZZZ